MKKLLLLTLLITLSAYGADNVVTDPVKLREITDTYRSDPNRPNDFVPQGNGTVIDKRTGLQWMRCSFGQKWTGQTCTGEPKEYLWQNAINLKQTFAGHSDWRLPNLAELETLVYCHNGSDEGRKSNKFFKDRLDLCGGDYSTSIAEQAFLNTGGNNKYKFYWSSVPNVKSDTAAWGVFFDGGYAWNYQKVDGAYVRLVRDGQ